MSKIFAALIAIRDIIYAIMAFTERVVKERRKKELKEAKDESLEERNQRKLEEAMGGGGKPTKHKYFGLFTRDSKKRQRDMVD